MNEDGFKSYRFKSLRVCGALSFVAGCLRNFVIAGVLSMPEEEWATYALRYSTTHQLYQGFESAF